MNFLTRIITSAQNHSQFFCSCIFLYKCCSSSRKSTFKHYLIVVTMFCYCFVLMVTQFWVVLDGWLLSNNYRLLLLVIIFFHQNEWNISKYFQFKWILGDVPFSKLVKIGKLIYKLDFHNLWNVFSLFK